MQVTEQPRQPRFKIIRYDRPCCPVHGVPMQCGSTGSVKRYFYCPVAGCRESQPMPKPKEERE